MTREERAREAAYALAAQHDIDLFRVIRRAGRKDRDKAKAISLYLAETIIAEAAAMRERAAECAMSSYDQWLAFRDKGGVTFGAERYDDHECDVAARTSLGIASAIRALPATGEVGRG